MRALDDVWARLRRERGAALPAIAAALFVTTLGAVILSAFAPPRLQLTAADATPTGSASPSTTEDATPSPARTPTLAPQAVAACPAGRVSFGGPSGAYVWRLAFTSATEGWATLPQGQPLRFTDCQWQPAGGPPDLGDISMIGPNEGWGIGSGADKRLYHYSDGQWLQDIGPAPQDASVYDAIRMFSADDGWIVGQYPKDQNGRFTFYALHDAGGTWTRLSLPIAWFYDLAAAGPGEAWLAGQDAGGSAVLLHLKDGQQTAFTPPNGTLGEFRVNAPDDIWLPGGYTAAYDYRESISAFVLHYDGAQWRQMPISDDKRVQENKGLAIFSAQDGWAFGAPLSLNTVTPINSAMRLTPSGWVRVAWPIAGLVGVRGVTKVGPDEYWAVGSAQTDVGQGATAETSVLLHYANGAWTAYGR